MTWERALSMVSFGRLVRLRASSTEATIFGVGIFLGATAKFSPFARIDCWLGKGFRREVYNPVVLHTCRTYIRTSCMYVKITCVHVCMFVCSPVHIGH